MVSSSWCGAAARLDSISCIETLVSYCKGLKPRGLQPIARNAGETIRPGVESLVVAFHQVPASQFMFRIET